MVVKKQFRQSHFEVPYFVFNHHTVLLAKKCTCPNLSSCFYAVFFRSLFNLETNSLIFFFFFFLCLCAHVSCRVVVSAVRCAACCRRANKLVGTFSLSAPAAPDAAAVGAAASSGGTTASWDEQTRDATRQQPGQHRRRRPPAQHSNCQHHHRGWKQSGVLVPQLPVPISTVSGAGGGL